MAEHFCCIAGRQAGVVSVVRFDDRAESAEIVHQLAVGAKPMPLIRGAGPRRLIVAAGTDPVQLITVEIDEHGKLDIVAEVPAPFAPTSMALSPDRRMLAAVCYHSSELAWVPLGAGGEIEADSWQVRPSGRQPHCIVFAPDGRFAYRSELGEDRVVGMRVDSRGLVDEEALGVQFPQTAGPRHILVEPGGEHVYVIEELGGQVVQLNRDVHDGRLGIVGQVNYYEDSEHLRPGVYVPPQRKPTDDEQRNRLWGADIVLGPGAHWLVASERRASTLTLWALEADGGFGARLDHVVTEKQPRAIGLVGPRHVVAGAEKGDSARFYRVGTALEPVAQLSGLGGPSWFQTVPA
ncbi:6-phosphogluconolactonase [Propionibacterium cyclohexanicum]|uniref:6-phosphogluconolactonase n=1 Tax=Propionibacterium cyclohexanicum TaxID=64702 RepID=A0A1H9SY77_9ACTN|nr:beta-propeller fold lactonase family protein [Propionibacterium cyclohexanicum]SER89895.1 6-phosphogluconolactonase [Propionibacterium cyclohexanicum]